MPWLYYDSEPADQVLAARGIPTQYNMSDSRLELLAAKYNVDGEFLGYVDATEGILQLCPASQNILEAAFKFGSFYEQSVSA